MEEITTRTLDAQGLTPARAYAALRAKAPNRTSYLLEMTEPDERGEQRSVIGFLAKREAAYPPACDALADFAAVAAAMPPAPQLAEVSASCCLDVLSVLLFDAVLTAHGLPPWPDQGFVGREIREASSIVIDHVAGTVTIAATNANVVERVARTLAAAPELPDLPPLAGSGLEYVTEQPLESAFMKQLGKAGRRLALGGIDRLRLGRTFTAAMRGADLFDVARALAELAPSRHVVFVEHSPSPIFPAYAVAGVAGPAVRLDAAAGAAALAKELLGLFPVEQLLGSPAKDALSAWREIALRGLGPRGGAIARARPGGVVEVLRPHVLVTFEEEQLHVQGLDDVVPGRDGRSHTEAAAADASVPLSAIRRAHDAAAAREAAAAASAAAPTL